MFKQSPSRNHRSKGIKAKRVLQICVLLAVCFWLIYQIKHSHDKKKEFEENDAKISHKKHVYDILEFGRKGLHPRLEETTMKNGKHDEEEVEEEETGGEEEAENKQHEEEEQEEDNKADEKEDEGRGGGDGDDEIDEHDQEKSAMEIEREEDFIDEEKEREEGDDEKEAEEKDTKDKGGQNENENSLEDHDHDGGSRNAQEAQEEHYRADDASSAVTHETEAFSTKTERGSSKNSNENTGMNSLEGENKANNTEEITVGQNADKGEMAENGISPNVTGKEDKGYEIVSSKLEDSSLSNSTLTTESNNQPEIGNNSTEGNSETNNISLQNGTETKLDASEAQNATVGGTTSEDSNLQTIALGPENNSNTASNNNQSDSNLMISSNTENLEAATRESSNSSTTSEFAASEKVTTSNASVEVQRTIEEHTDATHNEKSETSNGTDVKDESRDFAETEKDVRTDLGTLPEIRTEGSNNEDAAAE